MPLRLCHHIKTNGLQCLSPALKTGQWCYFHARPHQRHSAPPTIPARTSHRDLLHTRHSHSTPLNDVGSVHTALSTVINDLASNKIDTKRATALLYGLQLAASIAARHDPTHLTPVQPSMPNVTLPV